MSETRLKKIMNIVWTLIIENFKCIDWPKTVALNRIRKYFKGSTYIRTWYQMKRNIVGIG